MTNSKRLNAIEGVENAVSTHSSPVRPTHRRHAVAVVEGHCFYPLLRIDTNQGVYGLDEVHDGGHAENALQFKHMLIGRNPCNVDHLFKLIKRYGSWGREGGGVSGIEIALWDLIGKIYGVPCYQFLGRNIATRCNSTLTHRRRRRRRRSDSLRQCERARRSV